MAPEPGDSLGGFQIRSLISRGGMGAVYRAHQPGLDRDVALKVLLQEARSLTGERRFLRERDILLGLSHPHLPKFFDAGVEGDDLYFAMELIQGTDLTAHLEPTEQVPIPWCRRILGQVASAVQCLHRASIAHRDIKPDNIVLREDESAVLVDLGLASSPDRTALTTPGQIMGTLPFMSPEQIRGEGVSLATDIYSLGVTAYWMISGQMPYVGQGVLEWVEKIEKAEVRPLIELRPDTPPELSALVMRMLSRAVAIRPNIDHVVEELAAVREAPVKRNRSAVAVAVVAAVAACALVMLVALTRKVGTHPPVHESPSRYGTFGILEESVVATTDAIHLFLLTDTSVQLRAEASGASAAETAPARWHALTLAARPGTTNPVELSDPAQRLRASIAAVRTPTRSEVAGVESAARKRFSAILLNADTPGLDLADPVSFLEFVQHNPVVLRTRTGVEAVRALMDTTTWYGNEEFVDLLCRVGDRGLVERVAAALDPAAPGRVSARHQLEHAPRIVRTLCRLGTRGVTAVEQFFSGDLARWWLLLRADGRVDDPVDAIEAAALEFVRHHPERAARLAPAVATPNAALTASLRVILDPAVVTPEYLHALPIEALFRVMAALDRMRPAPVLCRILTGWPFSEAANADLDLFRVAASWVASRDMTCAQAVSREAWAKRVVRAPLKFMAIASAPLLDPAEGTDLLGELLSSPSNGHRLVAHRVLTRWAIEQTLSGQRAKVSEVAGRLASQVRTATLPEPLAGERALTLAALALPEGESALKRVARSPRYFDRYVSAAGLSLAQQKVECPATGGDLTPRQHRAIAVPLFEALRVQFGSPAGATFVLDLAAGVRDTGIMVERDQVINFRVTALACSGGYRHCPDALGPGDPGPVEHLLPPHDIGVVAQIGDQIGTLGGFEHGRFVSETRLRARTRGTLRLAVRLGKLPPVTRVAQYSYSSLVVVQIVR